MKFFFLTSILLLLIYCQIFAQTNQPCNCSPLSNDKQERLQERLIALTVKGSPEALEFYDEIRNSVSINDELNKSLQFLRYSKWENLEILKQRLNYLKKSNKNFLWVFKGKHKSPEDYANVYWIKAEKLCCLEQIISVLESNDKYKKWLSANKKERKQLQQDELVAAVDAARKKSPKPVLPIPAPVKPSDNIHNPNNNESNERNKNSDTQDKTELQKEVMGSYTILFDENEITLDYQDKRQLQEIIRIINERKVSLVTFEGFASITGSRQSNLAISMSRCFEVKEQLVAYGYKKNYSILPVGETTKTHFRAVIITLYTKKSALPEKQVGTH